MTLHQPPRGVIIPHKDVADESAARPLATFDQAVWDRYQGRMIDEIDPATYRASGGVFFVGYADGLPVVGGGYRPTLNGDAQVERLFVSSPGRRQGLGRSMLEHLEMQARLDGLGRAVLQIGLRQAKRRFCYEPRTGRRPRTSVSIVPPPSSPSARINPDVVSERHR